MARGTAGVMPDEPTQVSSGVVERNGDRRVIAVVAGAVLLLVAGFVVGRLGERQDAAPRTSAAPQPTGSTRPPVGERPRAVPGTSAAPAETSAPTLHDIDVVPAALPCGALRPADPLPAGIPEPSEILTAPVDVEGTLIPGSTSVAFEPSDSWSLAPVAGGGGAAAATINIAGLSIVAFGQLDGTTFDRQVTLAGCTAGAVSPGTNGHLWVLLYSVNETYVADIDRTARTVAWSARCDGCELLRDGGDGQVWVLGWQGLANFAPAGNLMLRAVDRDDHEVHAAVKLGEHGVPADVRGHVVVARPSESLAELSATDGSTISSAGANARVGRDPRAGAFDAPDVFDAADLWWDIEDDERVVGRSPKDLTVVVTIAATGIIAIAHAGADIWFQRNVGDDDHRIELVHLDAATRAVVSRRAFRSYRQFVPRIGPLLHAPELIVDAAGFWYAEPLPLPPDATLDGSQPVSGPYHLFRFDGR